jgi:hypothetical protein
MNPILNLFNIRYMMSDIRGIGKFIFKKHLKNISKKQLRIQHKIQIYLVKILLNIYFRFY